jgi:hypothetical protein
MNVKDLARLFSTFEHIAFRLETLQHYTVPSEVMRLRTFQQTGRVDRSQRADPWLRQVVENTAAGKRYYRVHIVDHPLSDYLRYELVNYGHNAAAGEEVCIADRASHPALEELREDFWMFDDRLVVIMTYDDQGRWRGASHAPPEALDDYRWRHDLALAHAVPLHEYLASQK